MNANTRNAIANIRTLPMAAIAQLAAHELQADPKRFADALYSTGLFLAFPGEGMEDPICADGTRREMMETFIEQSRGWDTDLADAIRAEYQRRIDGGVMEVGAIDTGNTAPEDTAFVAGINDFGGDRLPDEAEQDGGEFDSGEPSEDERVEALYTGALPDRG